MTVSAEELARFAVFAGLDDEHLEILESRARDVTYDAGHRLLTTDEPADRFYVLRSGTAAIEIHAPGRNPILVETVGAGEALGISWLLPPYRWTFDARSVDAIDAIELDADRLRADCDAAPSLGYALYQRFAYVLHERLVATRIRALDLYGAST